MYKYLFRVRQPATKAEDVVLVQSSSRRTAEAHATRIYQSHEEYRGEEFSITLEFTDEPERKQDPWKNRRDPIMPISQAPKREEKITYTDTGTQLNPL